MSDNLIKKLFLFWKKYINNTSSLSNASSGFNKKPSESEPITIFATHKNDYRDCGTARHNPFMPSSKYKNTSCFRIVNLLSVEIWKIAENHVLSEKIKNIYGRFDCMSKAVYSHRLSFDPDNKPYRHANIINWPSDKTAQKSCAQQIAAETIFHCELQYMKHIAQVSYNNKSKELVGEVYVDENKILFRTKSVNKLQEELERVIKSKGVQ